MCGRFYRYRSAADIAAKFGATPADHLDAPPGYNIPPSRQMLAVRFNPKTGERTLDALQWGLIPHFAKDRAYASRCSNARVDTKPSYRTAFQKRRCIVPLDGFIEWKTDGQREHPYAIAMRDQSLFGVAGLWEKWLLLRTPAAQTKATLSRGRCGLDPSTGEWLRTLALITTDANELVSTIHDRMPVILHENEYTKWLGQEPVAPATLNYAVSARADGNVAGRRAPQPPAKRRRKPAHATCT